MGGRLAARRLMAAPKESGVACSGSKCTVTLAYPAIAWRTSRRFFSAAARGIAGWLSRVPSRVPTSASKAVSPRAWIRTRGAGGRLERGGGMCAHKNGVERAWQEPDAQKPDARQRHDPGCHHRGSHHVPRRKVAPDLAQCSWKVEQVSRASRGGESARAMRHEQQQEQAPWQCEQKRRGDAGVDRR